MIVQLDGDIVTYRCAAATANDDEAIAKWQTSEMMNRILNETAATSFTCFLSGSGNFRYAIYPEYKANRRDMPRPKHYQAVREHLVREWKATVTDGIEADDAMGIAQCHTDNSCIASIDKDMLMIPGQHYNFVKQEFRTISPVEGLRNFYFQLIMGDRTDNIFGYDGKARQKVPKFLEAKIDELMALDTEMEMYDLVAAMYEDHDQMHTNGKCLWIMRKDGDYWQPPVRSSMEEGGPQDDFILL
jgi:5'-3' exonuclease